MQDNCDTHDSFDAKTLRDELREHNRDRTDSALGDAFDRDEEDSSAPAVNLPGIETKLETQLHETGYNTLGDVIEAKPGELVDKVPGIGWQLAERVRSAARRRRDRDSALNRSFLEHNAVPEWLYPASAASPSASEAGVPLADDVPPNKHTVTAEITYSADGGEPDDGDGTQPWQPLGAEYDSVSIDAGEVRAELEADEGDDPSILEEAEDIVRNGGGDGRNDDALETSEIIADLWNPYLERVEGELEPRHVDEMMILLKAARSVGGGPDSDHWRDMAGYALMADMAAGDAGGADE